MIKPLIDGKHIKSPQMAGQRLAKSLRMNNVESVLIALSGGADSVLTYHIFRLAAEKIPIRIGVCHVNFHLRGEESMRDERFVKELLEAFPPPKGIEFKRFFADYDTEAYCRENSFSIEIGARKLRHDLFRKIAREEGYQYLATGHTANDNEETLLMNLFRGCGASGLRAMLPITQNDVLPILRPILDFNKETVLRLLNQVEYPEDFIYKFITDSTNLDSDYRRNFLRNKVIPLIESEWEGIHTALQQSISIAAEEEKILNSSLDAVLGNADNRNFMPWHDISTYPSPETLIVAWLRAKGMTGKIACEISTHVPPEGQQCLTPGRQWKIREGIVTSTPKGLGFQSFLDGNPYDIGFGNFKFEMQEMREGKLQEVENASLNEVYLPKSPDLYYFRYHRKGERIQLINSSGSKLISDVLKEGKIAYYMRDRVSLLCRKEDDAIVWVPGLRRAGIDLITPETKNIWHLTPIYDIDPDI